MIKVQNQSVRFLSNLVAPRWGSPRDSLFQTAIRRTNFCTGRSRQRPRQPIVVTLGNPLFLSRQLSARAT